MAPIIHRKFYSWN